MYYSTAFWTVYIVRTE